MARPGNLQLGFAAGYVVVVALSVLPAVGAADDPSPPLRMDVEAAMQARAQNRSAADVQLSPLTVRGKRRLVDTLPCIGCDGRQLLPLKRLQDFTDIIGSLLISHPAARPETPEDQALSFAHEQTCIDDSGCLLPK